MKMNVNLMILNSSLVSYKFDDNREMKFNKITFAFRDETAPKELTGVNNILVCNVDPSSYNITKDIKPNDLVPCELSTKKSKDNTFKLTISKIKDITL